MGFGLNYILHLKLLKFLFWSYGKISPLLSFPFTELPNIFEYFGSKLAARNGTSPKYRSREVLSNTIDDDYDKESIEIVCKVYEMDFIM